MSTHPAHPHTVETVSVRQLSQSPGKFLRLALSGVAVRVINQNRPGAEVWLSGTPPDWWTDDGTSEALRRRQLRHLAGVADATTAARAARPLSVRAHANGYSGGAR